MKLPIENAPLFAADIDVSDYADDGIFILTIDELARIIQEWFRERRINCLFRDSVITGSRAKPLCELELSNEVGFAKVIDEIRQALDSKGIDYYEPFTATGKSCGFRFITPGVSVFR